MKNWYFPIITNISDVLPHIENREGFSVSERPQDGIIVVNYTHNVPGMFDIDPEDSFPGRIRRECRGMFFDIHTGNIVSRPFHKFFNLNEIVETQRQNIEFSNYSIHDKLDGSMIRPIIVDNELRLATKAGITETSIQCEKEINFFDIQIQAMITALNMNLTPIFEYVSPNNKIVLNYEEPKLVLLAIRENISGKYIHPSKVDILDIAFEKAKKYESSKEIDDFISILKDHKGRDVEGVVIWFDNGYVLKVKTQLYVDLHQKKDAVTFPHKVIRMYYVDNTIDDVIPDLDKVDQDRVKDNISEFEQKFEDIKTALDEAYNKYSQELTRKDVAIQMSLDNVSKRVKSYVFWRLDNKDREEFIENMIESALRTSGSYEEFLKWEK